MEESEVQSPQLHNEFEGRLSYVRPCLRQTNIFKIRRLGETVQAGSASTEEVNAEGPLCEFESGSE